MNNSEKLKNLLMDVFLLEDGEFSFDLTRSDIETWDSLGTVSMAVGIQEEFGYHMTPDEATHVNSISEICNLLEAKGISFEN